MASFWKDPDLQKFGDSIVAQHRPEKAAGARFNFVFKDGKAEVIAKSQKVPKMWKDLGVIDADFLIVINAELWKELSREQKEAGTLHEICHCEVEVKDDGSYNYKIIPHEIEDFHLVYEKYGDYMGELNKLLKEAREKKAAKAKLRKKK